MVYGPAETLSEISELEGVDAGDLILTGTPGGVALQPPGALLQRLVARCCPRSCAGRRSSRRRSAAARTSSRATGYAPPSGRADGAIDLGTQDTIVR